MIAVVPILAVVAHRQNPREQHRLLDSEHAAPGPVPAHLAREAKHKAKAAIDTFFTRTGDVVSAGVVALGQVTALTVSAFACVQRSPDDCLAVGCAADCAGTSPPDGVEAISSRSRSRIGRRQHLVQILDREAAEARERRSDAVDRRVERLAPDDRRQQLKDVFEMARLRSSEDSLRAAGSDLRSIEQMVAAPSLRRHGQLPFDHGDDFRAVEGQFRILRSGSDRWRGCSDTAPRSANRQARRSGR